MKHKTIRQGASLLMGSVLLVACSGGEPSEKDIKQVITEEYGKVNKLTQSMLGADAKHGDDTGKIVEVHSVRKIDCAKEDKKGMVYLCTVEVDATKPFVGRKKETTKVHLTKDNGKWKSVS
jgi:hypothetical protein